MEVTMKVAAILDRKGHDVHTVPPGATVAEVSRMLSAHRVGALVVSDDGEVVVGIVSERDVVRHLHARGGALLDASVSEIMTTVVATCRPADTVEALSVTMTERRIRHVPVLDDDDRLTGIVSIGDVVKSRIGQLEEHREQLEAYING
jgi:CBS domain-containing protein